MDTDVSYKILTNFMVGEIKAILNVVRTDSLCHYLLADTLKHAETLQAVIAEPYIDEERKREAETSPIPQ